MCSDLQATVDTVMSDILEISNNAGHEAATSDAAHADATSTHQKDAATRVSFDKGIALKSTLLIIQLSILLT